MKAARNRQISTPAATRSVALIITAIITLAACQPAAMADDTGEQAAMSQPDTAMTSADDKTDSKPLIVNRAEPEAMSDGSTRLLFDVRSPSMKRDINVALVIPPVYQTDEARRFPVLYAMHGMGAPYKTFTDMAALRRTMKDRPFILVAFNGDTAGWYIDSTVKSDSQFTTFFFDELIPAIDANFRTRTDALSRATTGFSMGGYGSLHYMLTRPDMIGSASSLSGAFGYMGELSNQPHASLTALLGPFADKRDGYLKNGIFNRISQYVKDRKPLPPIYLHCGTEDHLISESRNLATFLMEQNTLLKGEKAEYTLVFQYRESPGGHNWPFWRDASAAVADFHWRIFESAK